MEHHKADVRQVAGYGTAGDDAARFLRELRQLRDGAGLGHAELAARAHYPYDTIKAAEAGPTLPDLPVLSAFVRGCGGTAEEWEERWRRLTRTPSLPVPASRHAGNSAAATAGARIGATTEVVDAPDPSAIIAALSRVAEGMAVGGSDMDEAPLTVPPRSAYPAEDSLADVPLADTSLGDVSLDDIPLGDASLDDISLADISLADISLADIAGALADVSLADAFTASPADSPADAPADFSTPTPATPATPATLATPADEPLAVPADDPLVSPPVGSTTGPAEPAADDRPKGWDPIRVSTAWPAIGDEDRRTARVSEDTPRSAAAARPGPGAPAGRGTRDAIRQSAWARGADAFGEPTGVARPGSRARTLMVVVVLVCVLAVVLAIFA